MKVVLVILKQMKGILSAQEIVKQPMLKEEEVFLERLNRCFVFVELENKTLPSLYIVKLKWNYILREW